VSDLADFQRRSVAECDSATVVRALTAAFEGYFVPMRISVEQFERRFRAEHLDPLASAVWFAGDEPAILLLICRRGWRSRMAAFGVAKPWRSKGLARVAVGVAVDEARARGDSQMVLEVIEGNTHAIRLYESHGFRTVRRLVGYEWASMPPEAGERAELREIDLVDAAAMMMRFADAGLSWQLSPVTLMGLVKPTRGFALEDSAVALIDTTKEAVRLRALAVAPQHRRCGLGRRLLLQLRRDFPAPQWAIPAIVPDRLGQTFLERLGWRVSALSQREMVLELAPAVRERVQRG
jgi:GNAT superfamily N-acetyltransferase